MSHRGVLGEFVSRVQALGEAIGFAIHVIETKRLLFADAVLEFEFRLADVDQFLLRHSERFECELSVEGYVATKSGGWLLYVEVERASPAAVDEAATDLDDLERVRVVRDGGDAGLVEYRFGESSLLGTLAEAGVKLGAADADTGSGRFVLEASQDAAVRELIGRVNDVNPTATLVAQRERDRSVVEFDVPGGLTRHSPTASARRSEPPTARATSSGPERVPPRRSPSRWGSLHRRSTDTSGGRNISF